MNACSQASRTSSGRNPTGCPCSWSEIQWLESRPVSGSSWRMAHPTPRMLATFTKSRRQASKLRKCRASPACSGEPSSSRRNVGVRFLEVQLVQAHAVVLEAEAARELAVGRGAGLAFLHQQRQLLVEHVGVAHVADVELEVRLDLRLRD